MSVEEQTINSISSILSISIGFIFIITGLIGNMINILVFTQLKLFRNNQSAFYLTLASISGSCQIIFTQSPRVVSAAFGYDPTKLSIVWCKLRIYIAQFGGLVSMAILCLTAIDQYLSTSYDIRLRQLNTFKLAQRLVGIVIVFAALYSIPVAIFNNIQPKAGCVITDSTYNYYYSFVHICIVIAILPAVMSSFFSILAYRNVHRIIRRQVPIVRRRLDQQLTVMILVRVALYVITVLPYGIVRAYQSNQPVDQKDTYAVAVSQLLQNIVTLLFNLNQSASFYIFLAVSTRFRRQVKYLFCRKIWPRFLTLINKNNQVLPFNQQETVESHISNIEKE